MDGSPENVIMLHSQATSWPLVVGGTCLPTYVHRYVLIRWLVPQVNATETSTGPEADDD